MAMRRGVHELTLAADRDVPTRQLLLLDVPLEVVIDSAQSFRCETGVGWATSISSAGIR